MTDAPGAPRIPPTLLLVEDNAEDLELALRALRGKGLDREVLVARDGVEARELLATAALPRVILLDLKLPRVGGAEVLRALKSDPRLRAIPVVVFTSSREPSDIAEAYRLGANSYVVKPLDPDAFAEHVATVGAYWLTTNLTAC